MKIFENITNGYRKIASGIAIVAFLTLMYFALIPGGTIAASSFVTTASGDMIDGAVVKLADYPQYNTTSVAGAYSIPNVPYGSYFILTTHPSYAPNLTSVNLSSANLLKNITMEPCRNTFTDVNCSDWNYVYTMYLFDNGVTSGYPDGTFKPNNQITRAEVATFIVRAMGLTYTGGQTNFTDVPSTHWAYNFVMAAKQAGIIGGYPDGTFKPDNLVTRAEISVMVTRARGWTYSGVGVDFTDVPQTHWSYPFIMSVKEKKIVGGYPDGTFKPDNKATRAETSVMVSKMKLWQ